MYTIWFWCNRERQLKKNHVQKPSFQWLNRIKFTTNNRKNCSQLNIKQRETSRKFYIKGMLHCCCLLEVKWYWIFWWIKCICFITWEGSLEVDLSVLIVFFSWWDFAMQTVSLKKSSQAVYSLFLKAGKFKICVAFYSYLLT